MKVKFDIRIALRLLLIIAPFLVFLVAQTSRLHDAVAKGDVKAVASALKPWKFVDARNNHGNTPLSIAIRRGDAEIVSFLLSRGAKIQLNSSRYDADHLLPPVSRGKIDIVKLLVDKGADVNRKDSHYGSALHEAARKGHVELVKFLLARGANVDIEDAHGLTPLFASFGWSDPGLRDKKMEISSLLLAHGADIAKEFPNGHTLMSSAIFANASKGDLDQVRFLLDHGFPLTRKKKEKSPLNIAAYVKQIDTVRLLLEYGADANDGGIECDRDYCPGGMSTALHRAAELKYAKQGGEKASLEITELLIERGAKVNVLDEHGNAPILYAAQSRLVLVVRTLLDAGANPNLGSSVYKPLDPNTLEEITIMLRQAGACSGREKGCVPKEGVKKYGLKPGVELRNPAISPSLPQEATNLRTKADSQAITSNIEVHSVRVYEGTLPSGSPSRGFQQHPEGSVTVSVFPTAKPVGLFLTAYEPVNWIIELKPGARLERVVTSGYHQQRVTFMNSQSVPVATANYSGNEEGKPSGAERAFGIKPTTTSYQYKGKSFDLRP